MGVDVNFGGFDRKVNQMMGGDGLRRGLRAARLHVGGKLQVYPPVSRRSQSQYWSPRQRRGFFAKLRSGEIDVPYRRGLSPSSERLAARWAQSASADGMVHTIGNNASYVNLVQGADQTAYHKQTGWKTAADIVKEERAEVNRIVSNEVRRDVFG